MTPAAAQATGLPAGTPVVLGGHDYLCGALPVGAIRPGVILDVSGTWEIVLATTEQPVLTPEAQRTGVTVEAHVARDLYAIWGGAVSADMLEWYRKEFGFEAKQQADACGGVDWDYPDGRGGGRAGGRRGVMFLPHLSGSGCPMVDPRSLGAFVGLSNFAAKGDMLRAVIEGLDYQFLDIVQTMQGCGRAVRPAGRRRRRRPQQVLDAEQGGHGRALHRGARRRRGHAAGRSHAGRHRRGAVRRRAGCLRAGLQARGSVYEPDPAARRDTPSCSRSTSSSTRALAPVSHQLYDRFLA